MGFVVASDGTKERVQREIPKKGPRLAKLVGLIDLGMQVVVYQGEPKRPCRQVLPLFHLLNDKYTDDKGDLQCMAISPYFGMGIMPGAERSKYMKFCTAIDPDNSIMRDGVGDLQALLGRHCFVNVKHNEKEGITYGNYVDCAELPEDYPKPEHDCKFTVFDTENPDPAVFDKLWDHTKEMIREMEDYETSKVKVLCDGGRVVEKARPVAQGADVPDSDIPF